MLYGIIRYGFGFVILIIVLSLINKSQIINKRRLHLASFIIIAILTSLLYFIPVENLFISFSSPEKAFNYINSWKIQHIVNGSETDLIISGKNETNTCKILPKTDKGWKISTGLETKKYKGFHNGISIGVYRYKNSNDYYVVLFNTDGGKIDVSDSRGSQFSFVNKTDTASSEPIYYYCTCVYNLDDMYVLNLNGEEVKIGDAIVIP